MVFKGLISKLNIGFVDETSRNLKTCLIHRAMMNALNECDSVIKLATVGVNKQCKENEIIRFFSAIRSFSSMFTQ